MKRRTSLNDSTAANNTPQDASDRPVFPQALLDHVMAHYQKPADLIGENGMLKQFTRAVFEAALNAEMAQHLGHTRHGSVGNQSGNVRNGHSAKTISGDFGEVDITIPRDRDASFSRQLLPKHQRRVPGFDERILSPYARGMSTRQIAAQLHEMLDVEVSPTLISTITDTVADEVRAWQSRPLDKLYPILYLDCLMVKTREAGSAANRDHLPGHWCQYRGAKGSAGLVDGTDRRGQVLALGGDGIKEPWRRRHSDCLRRWAQGVSGGYRSRVP